VAPGRAADWADAVQRLTADWPAARTAARADAREARRRHDPARYREELTGVMTSLPRAAVPAEPVRSAGS
jgi:hypothetical protein